MTQPFACTLASSSAGNATLFSDGKTHILLDAGLSGRALSKALARFSLSAYDLSAVLITHEHSDHIQALPALPKHIPVYATLGTSARLPGTPQLIAAGNAFAVNDVVITPFATPHDTPDSVGYVLQQGAYRMALATDMGYMPPDVLSLLADIPVLFLESNYDEQLLSTGRYPPFLKKRIAGSLGHLSNYDCAQAALACVNRKLRSLVLMHLSKDNNRPELAFATTEALLNNHGVVVGQDVQLQVAPRSEPCEPVSLYADC